MGNVQISQLWYFWKEHTMIFFFLISCMYCVKQFHTHPIVVKVPSTLLTECKVPPIGLHTQTYTTVKWPFHSLFEFFTQQYLAFGKQNDAVVEMVMHQTCDKAVPLL